MILLSGCVLVLLTLAALIALLQVYYIIFAFLSGVFFLIQQITCKAMPLMPL